MTILGSGCDPEGRIHRVSEDFSNPEARLRLSRSLAGCYGKRFGALVTSGSAALEVALLSLGVSPGDRVLLPDNCCHQVPASVLRVGALPLLAPVGEAMVLTVESVAAALPMKPQAIIAIHHLGLPCDLSAIQSLVGPQVALIEDAAQAWSLKARGRGMGTSSDVVVTSFGMNKPISIGDGGGVFSDSPRVEELIDRWSSGQRFRPSPPLPYALSHHALPQIAQALRRADVLIAKRRRFANVAIPLMLERGLRPWLPSEGDEPSWQFLPIWTDCGDVVENCRRSPLANIFNVARPHPAALVDLPMLQGRVAVAPRSPNAGESRHCLLLGTDREASINEIEKFANLLYKNDMNF